MSKDFELGKQVQAKLVELGLETPIHPAKSLQPLVHVENAFVSIMHALSLDLSDDSLRETPKRVAKMYCSEIFRGLDYENFPKCTTVSNKMKYNELLMVKGIAVSSMCEHHFLPFIGTAKVGYIVKERVLGLSKFSRVVQFFARRPQIQERLTEQVYAALSLITDTEDVAVVIDSKHLCVKLRGVEDSDTSTITSKMGGKFMDKPALRNEFLSL